MNDLYRLQKDIADELGNRRLNYIDTEKLFRLSVDLREEIERIRHGKDSNRAYSKNTVRLVKAALSSVLSDAVDDGYLPVNPAFSAGRKRGKRAEALTQAERLQRITRKGDTVAIPPEVPHSFRVVGDEVLRLLGTHASPTRIVNYKDGGASDTQGYRVYTPPR